MKYSRREFLASTLGCVAVAGVGLKNTGPSAAPIQSPKTTVQNGILHRELGRTGLVLPIVGMGVMNARDPALIRKAYETGMRHFDTAAAYGSGRNEEMLGRVIKDMGVRNDVAIATKVMVPNLRKGLGAEDTKKKFIRMVEASLKSLDMEHVDIIYLHDVGTAEDVRIPGIQDAVARLKQDGKVRFSGFTTHQNMAACIEEAVQAGFYDVILTSFNVALANDQRLSDTLKQASERGIGLIAMKTQCSQYWYKQNLPETLQKYYDGNILNSAVLKWVLRHPFITTSVPGVTAFQHITDDFAVARDLDYTPEEARFLKERNIQARLGICRQCRWCASTCPKSVEIHALMRSHMYSFCYQNPEQAAETLKNIAWGRGLRSCAGCDSCLARCRHGLDIRGRIEELKTVSV